MQTKKIINLVELSKVINAKIHLDSNSKLTFADASLYIVLNLGTGYHRNIYEISSIKPF